MNLSKNRPVALPTTSIIRRASPIGGIALIALAFLAAPLEGVAAAERFRDVYNGWSFKKSLPANYKRYGYSIVSESYGHPVRDGKKSMRFEVRAGDCSWSQGWSDCENDRERHELRTRNNWRKGEYWYHWSLYLPRDYPIVYPVKVSLGQFHQKGSHPVWMFQNSSGGYFVDNQTVGSTLEKREILTDEEMRGRWSDVLVHARWTHEDDGFFRVYVNGETSPRYTWSGPTKRRGKRVYFKLGIYRSLMSRRPGDEPTQVVYFDHVNRAKSCKRATRYFDCKRISAK